MATLHTLHPARRTLVRHRRIIIEITNTSVMIILRTRALAHARARKCLRMLTQGPRPSHKQVIENTLNTGRTPQLARRMMLKTANGAPDMTQLAFASPSAFAPKARLSGASTEASFIEWALGCLHRMGALEDRAKANRWFMTAADDQRRRVAMSALFPGQNPWDHA